jgi:hypothetical protein
MNGIVLDAEGTDAGGYRVSESLAAPMLPNVEHHITGRNVVTVEEYYLETLLADVTVAGTGGERLAFVNKSFPHSRFDMMVLAASDTPHCAVTDMRRESLDAVWHLAGQFVSYVSRPDIARRFGLDGGHLHMAFNFNRDTIDRENSMFYDKRFHLHLNYWPKRDLTPAPPRRLADVEDRLLRRRLLDPISFLGPRIMFEKLNGTAGALALLEPDPKREVDEQLPPGLKALLGGWDRISDGTLADALTEIHRAAEEAYREIFHAFTGLEYRSEPWWRPRIRDAADVRSALSRLGWLSVDTADDLVHLAGHLRNLGAGEMAEIRASERRQIAELAVASLDYSVSVVSVADPHRPPSERGGVYLIVHFKLLSDIGGAGLTWLPGVPIVRVNRAHDHVFTAAEVAERREFQDLFLKTALSALDRDGVTVPELFRDHRAAS